MESKIESRTVGEWFRLGLKVQEQDPEKAIACYNKATQLDPEDAHAWYNKGVALGYLGGA